MRICIYVLIVGQAFDLLTSILSKSLPRLIESNPLFRNEESKFALLSKGTTIKLTVTLLLITFSQYLLVCVLAFIIGTICFYYGAKNLLLLLKP